MKKRTATDVFKMDAAKPETAMDKTTRIVKEMIDEEAEKRQAKMTRLRNARLEREAHTPADTKATAAQQTRRRPAASTHLGQKSCSQS